VGLNITNMVNRSRKDYAYTLLDLEEAPSQTTLDHIASIESILRVRLVY